MGGPGMEASGSRGRLLRNGHPPLAVFLEDVGPAGVMFRTREALEDEGEAGSRRLALRRWYVGPDGTATWLGHFVPAAPRAVLLGLGVLLLLGLGLSARTGWMERQELALLDLRFQVRAQLGGASDPGRPERISLILVDEPSLQHPARWSGVLAEVIEKLLDTGWRPSGWTTGAWRGWPGTRGWSWRPSWTRGHGRLPAAGLVPGPDGGSAVGDGHREPAARPGRGGPAVPALHDRPGRGVPPGR